MFRSTLLFVGSSALAWLLLPPARADVRTSDAPRHWAYVTPVRPALPEVEHTDWPRNAIDAFVLARLEAHGLEPAPEAERARLVRRLYYDLVGLPPTVEEVDAYLADTSPRAYEAVVDRLLASPAYGEKWARQWLDLARYADSNGYQRDGHRSAWPYRDWVIRAINEDMPFDRFSIEQLAGDLLPHATIDQQIATGFHRSTTVNVEAGVDREEDRINAVIDRVNTTGTVWLGTTLACARCHSHKYDPISQREYYGLFAYFNNTEVETSAGNGSARQFIGPRIQVTEPEHRALERRKVTEELARERRRLDDRTAAAKSAQQAWERDLHARAALDELPRAIRDALTTPRPSRTKGQSAKLTKFYLNRQSSIRRARARIAELEKRLGTLAPPTSLTMAELKTPRETRLLRRGDFLRPGEPVEPGVPEVLHPLDTKAPPNRLTLARWLCDPSNPLIGRVTVNRWWAEFMGRGLVATPEDFGTQGDPPTHPGLLDWLAVELINQGWSRKAIHRLIVTSATYRQSSKLTGAAKKDPLGTLYSRAPRFRLAAETIRDGALAISGLLQRGMGGPPVRPPQPDGIWTVTGVVDNTYRTSEGPDRYRRGVYTVWRRSSPYPSFVAFDAPDRTFTCVQRPRTNTPLQALTLLNDPVYVEAAFALAAHIARRPVTSPDPDAAIGARATYGFRRCLSRHPTPEEVRELARIFRDERKRFGRDPAALRELLQGRHPSDGSAPLTIGEAQDRDLGAWFFVATILLNLDETITKG